MVAVDDDDGSWSLFFHFINILIFVDCYTLAMTKMKCSILGHEYTGTDVFALVCRRRRTRRRKNSEGEKASEILSLSPSLMFECQAARLYVYKCIQLDEHRRRRKIAKDFDRRSLLCIELEPSECVYNCLRTSKVYRVYSLDCGHIRALFECEEEQQSKQGEEKQP